MQRPRPILFFLLVIAISASLKAQNDSINLTDEQGWKQGRWVVRATPENAGCREGQVLEEGKYKDNRKIETWKKFWCNGKLKSETVYKPDRTIYSKTFYENGKLSEEGTWNSQGWIGPYKYYYESGQLYYEWVYDENGKRTGHQKYFYENGNLMYDGAWNAGKETGVFKEYYEDGSVKAEKYFNDGKLDTTRVTIYPPKPKKQEEKIQTEVKPPDPVVPKDLGYLSDGFHKTLTRDGQVELEGDFKGGKLFDGKKYFYENGKLVKTAIIVDGKTVKFIYEKAKTSE